MSRIENPREAALLPVKYTVQIEKIFMRDCDISPLIKAPY